MRSLIKLALVTAIILLSTAPMAHADAIDGNWCNPEGGNFEIRGSEILTPGGTRMAGVYTRHTFRYVAPDGDRASGQSTNMALIDNETLHLLIEGSNGEIEIWRRCSVHTS